MDQTARDQAIANLLRQHAELSNQLAQLGVKPAEAREMKAPDGAAISNAHQFMSPKFVKTMRVRFKNVANCDEAIIRHDQFDPEKHEVIEQPRAPRAIKPVGEGKGSKRAKGFAVSEHTRDELLTMTIPALRLLPEVRSGMDADAIPDKKADLVDAILRVREEAGALTE